jgi:hypothetical protein
MLSHLVLRYTAAFPPDLYAGLTRDSNNNPQPHDITDIYKVIANIIEILLSLIAVLAVIFVIYAGIQYIISSGDPGKTATAKATITNAAVGIILSAGAYLIVDFLARQF